MRRLKFLFAGILALCRVALAQQPTAPLGPPAPKQQTESAAPAAFVTRTQYPDVAVSAGDVQLADVAPEIGDDEEPLLPANH